MWTQIVGKIRLMQTPPVNHSWHTTFYLTSRGMTTSPIPYGVRTFEINFDFIDHKIYISASDGGIAGIDLYARSVADLYKEIFAKLAELDIHVKINAMPCEIETDIRLDEDDVHSSYEPEYATRFWRVLVGADRVFKRFRGGFIGKCSPVHFFWGAPDLAVTRFSGRHAPEHPAAFLTCRIVSRVRRTRTKSAASDYGRETNKCPRLSFILMRIPNPPNIAMLLLFPGRPRSIPTLVNSFFRTRRSADRHPLTTHCSNSPRARTKPPQTARSGTEKSLNESLNLRNFTTP